MVGKITLNIPVKATGKNCRIDKSQIMQQHGLVRYIIQTIFKKISPSSIDKEKNESFIKKYIK